MENEIRVKASEVGVEPERCPDCHSFLYGSGGRLACPYCPVTPERRARITATVMQRFGRSVLDSRQIMEAL